MVAVRLPSFRNCATTCFVTFIFMGIYCMLSKTSQKYVYITTSTSTVHVNSLLAVLDTRAALWNEVPEYLPSLRSRLPPLNLSRYPACLCQT
ncbi:hypothetical protein K443DRAFT_503797 [Laccaria amethystina LaAM-08-1]|uniref:Uncharacterized protein n=1 Tax=Laccaria amethystina LaAM-08-1 TaxID=1095629 RepID=A0A0C9XNH3_9AGAR|nr:hypothetical protein K443DRAFT_503797 [Laccaria amethystina LaAM-08-1]